MKSLREVCQWNHYVAQRAVSAGVILCHYLFSFWIYCLLWIQIVAGIFQMQTVWEEGGGEGGSMIEILVKLQEVIWTGACKREKEWFPSASVCTPRFVWNEASGHMTHAVSFASWIPENWPAAYQFLAEYMKLTIILIRPHQHKPSVHLLPMKPTDHLSENPCWVKRLFGLKGLKICTLWSHQEDGTIMLRPQPKPWSICLQCTGN